MQAQLDALELLANNLANVNTTGFKEEKSFFTLVNQSIGTDQASESLHSAVHSSVRAQGALNSAEGSMRMTNRDLDIAIEGNGFLVIRAPQGLRYTRNGSLRLDGHSILTTADGFQVLGVSDRPITLGPGKVHINHDGEIFLNDTRVDRLKIVTFDSLSSLMREGNSLFVQSAGQQAEKVSDAKIKSGYLEQSNVDPVSSVVQLVEIMRQFEALQRCVHLIMNDMNTKSIEKLGR